MINFNTTTVNITATIMISITTINKLITIITCANTPANPTTNTINNGKLYRHQLS